MEADIDRMPRKSEQGFTLIEVLITTFVIGVVVTGMFGLLIATLRSVQVGERRIVAVALANERMEMVRNLPYVNVGTQDGVPAGAIAQDETIERNGQDYRVKTEIRYVDDEYDGQVTSPSQEEEKVTICHKTPGTSNEKTLIIGASALDAHLAHGDFTGPCGGSGEGTEEGDEYNADYKQVRVEVSWPDQLNAKPVRLITYVVPDGVEGGELGGTLDLSVTDADGLGVEGVDVQINNDTLDPIVAISTQTNAEGHLVLPALPEAANSYQLVVSKSGYTTQETYDSTDNFFPSSEYSHISMLIRQVTEKTVNIDRVAKLSVLTQDEDNDVLGDITYNIHGTKVIGQDADSNPVFKVDETSTTNASGIYQHEDLEWDKYDIVIDGVATGYDIAEANPPLPVALAPGDDVAVVLRLAVHNGSSLLVTVLDTDGAAVNNATITITDPSGSIEGATGDTGQAYFNGLSDADYTMVVNAPGYALYEQTVMVEGVTRVSIQMIAE